MTGDDNIGADTVSQYECTDSTYVLLQLLYI